MNFAGSKVYLEILNCNAVDKDKEESKLKFKSLMTKGTPTDRSIPQIQEITFT